MDIANTHEEADWPIWERKRRKTMAKAPDYEELAKALRIMVAAYDHQVVRDGLSYIGLGHWAGNGFGTTDEARTILLRLEEALGETQRAAILRENMDRPVSDPQAA